MRKILIVGADRLSSAHIAGITALAAEKGVHVVCAPKDAAEEEIEELKRELMGDELYDGIHGSEREQLIFRLKNADYKADLEALEELCLKETPRERSHPNEPFYRSVGRKGKRRWN